MSDSLQTVRRLHLTADHRSYELLAPREAMICPQELGEQLGAPVRIVPPLAAEGEDLGGAPLVDIALRDTPEILIGEDSHAAQGGPVVRLVPAADSQWVRCALPIPPLPVPALEALEQQTVEGTVGHFTERRIRERLEETLDLPPLPETTRGILALSGNPDAHAGDLVVLVEQDAALAARIVGWANSAFYSARGDVNSVHDAVVRVIGYRGALALAMGLAVGAAIPSPVLPAHGCPSYWIESLLTASVMDHLHQRAAGTLPFDSGTAYLAGLLSNFGTLVLGHTFAPQYQRICDLQSANRHLLYSYCDVAVLGMDREMVGSALLASWDLPGVITRAIREQHFEQTELPLARLVSCARSLLAMEGLSSTPNRGLPLAAAQPLGLGEAELKETLEVVTQPREELEVLARMFQRSA